MTRTYDDFWRNETPASDVRLAAEFEIHPGTAARWRRGVQVPPADRQLDVARVMGFDGAAFAHACAVKAAELSRDGGVQ